MEEEIIKELLENEDAIHLGRKCTCGNLLKVVYSETSYQLACIEGCQLALGTHQLKAALDSTPETRKLTWKVRPKRVICLRCWRIKLLYRFKKY